MKYACGSRQHLLGNTLVMGATAQPTTRSPPTRFPPAGSESNHSRKCYWNAWARAWHLHCQLLPSLLSGAFVNTHLDPASSVHGTVKYW